MLISIYKKRRSNILNADPITGETADISVIKRSNRYILVPVNINFIKKLQHVQVNLLPRFSFPATGHIGFIT